MKIREGFVSNSSSSSFIVHIREYKLKPTGKEKYVRYPKGVKILGKSGVKVPDYKQVSTPLLITREQLEALKKRGYKYCGHAYASRIEEGCKPEDMPARLATFMYFQVACNEADEVEYLVKHGIPFEGSTHYGHYSVFFQPGKDRVYIARNLGRAIETYKNIRDERQEMKYENDNMLRSQSVKSILKEGWNK